MSALKPDAVDTHTLGTSALPWQTLHADALHVGARATGANVPTLTEVTIGSNAKLTAGPSVPVNVEIFGSLTVHGASTTISSSTLEIADLNITVAQGAANSAAANGAGLVVDGASASLLYSHVGTQWEFNKPLEVAGSVLPETGAKATADLGSTALPWNDLHLSSGGIVNFNNGDVTATHSSNLLTITGGNTRVDRLEIDSANDHIDVSTDLTLTAAADIALVPGGGDVKVTGNLLPNADDGGALGASGIEWSDLFLHTGGVINFEAGDVTLTHSSNLLSIAGGNTRVIRLEIDSADDHIDVDTNLTLTAAADIALVPGGGDVAVTGNVVPNADDGGALGSANLNWSDLFIADAGVLNLGDDQDIKITHVADTGLLLTTTAGDGDVELQFRDAGLKIHSSENGQLDINSDGEVEISAVTNVDIDAADVQIDASATFSIQGADDSDITVDASAKDLSLVVSGGGAQILSLASAGTGTDAIDISASAGGVDIDANGVLALDGAGGIDIGKAADVAIDVDSAAFDLDASGAITIDAAANIELTTSADDGELKLVSAHTAGVALHIDANANAGSIVDIDAGILDIDADAGITIDSTTLSIDSADTTNLTMTANANSEKVLTIDAINSNVGGSKAAKIVVGATSGTAVSIGHTTSETTVNDNLTVIGDLIVQGTTTQIDTTNLRVEDRVIQLAKGDAADADVDQGFVFTRATANLGGGSDKEHGALFFKGSDNSGSGLFVLGVTNDDGSVAWSDGIADDDLSSLKIGKLMLDGTANHIDVDTNLTLTAAADIALVPGGSDVLVTGNILPVGDDTFDLGSSSAAWKDLNLEGDVKMTDAGQVVTAAGALTLNGAAGVTVTSTGGGLTLNGAGQTVDFNANVLDLDMTDSSNITITSSEAAEDLTIEQVGGNDSSIIIQAAGTGTDAIKLNTSAGSIDIDSADNLTIDAADLITLTTADTGADGKISLVSATTGANVAIHLDGNANAESIVDIDAGVLDIDATAGITIDGTTLSIDSTDTTNLTMTANAASEKVLTIDAANSNGSGTAKIALGTTSATAVSIGHATSETTVNDNLTVTGTSDLNGNTTLGGANLLIKASIGGDTKFKVLSASGNTTINGSLTVGGEIAISDTLVSIGKDGNANTSEIDIGLYAPLTAGENLGLIWDQSAAYFKLNHGLNNPADNVFDFSTGTPSTLELGKLHIKNAAEDAGNNQAIPLTTHATYYVTAGAENSSLGAGTEGQIKVLAMKSNGGDALNTMTVTVAAGAAAWGGNRRIVLTDDGDACTLQFIDSKWYAIGNNGCTFN